MMGALLAGLSYQFVFGDSVLAEAPKETAKREQSRYEEVALLDVSACIASKEGKRGQTDPGAEADHAMMKTSDS